MIAALGVFSLLVVSPVNAWWLSVSCSAASSFANTTQKTHQGNSFYNDWKWFTYDDPTQGTVDYVSQGTGRQLGLTWVTDSNQFGMRVESAYMVGQDERGRKSIRIESHDEYGKGSMFVLDVAHMPQGCGTWPGE